MKKNLMKLLMVTCFMFLIIGIVKFDAVSVQASTKKLQGGHSMKTSKNVSKKNEYIIKLKGEQGFWYKFKTPNYSTYFSYNIKNLSIDSSVYMHVYTKYREEVGYECVYKNQSESNGFNERLRPSTWYYIYVENTYNSSMGYYRFSFNLRKDSISNTMNNAKTIKTGKTYTNSIDGKSDEDWFKFKPTYSGMYTFCIKGSSNNCPVYGYVYSKYGEELGYDYSYNSMCSYSVKLKKNKWYYIKISDNYDNSTIRRYRFSIS